MLPGMTKEEFAAYQKQRRAKIRGGDAVTTVAGLAGMYRAMSKELDARMDKLERWREFHERNHDWPGYHKEDRKGGEE